MTDFEAGTSIENIEFKLARWQEWRLRRERELADPHGWLSLVSFQWLTSEPVSVSGFPGEFWEAEDGAHARFSPDDAVTQSGQPVTEVRIGTAEDGSDFSLRAGDVIAEVGMRGGRYMVRVRDPRSETLANFSGVPVFPYRASNVVVGKFRAYNEPREVEISTAREGLSGRARLVGEVSFEYDGAAVTLAVQGDADEQLTVLFHDETNGQETDAWRFVSFPGPGANHRESAGQFVAARAGDVQIDFNRALNFPMAFSDFATCPAPPAGNSIPARVEAGEKKAR